MRPGEPSSLSRLSITLRWRQLKDDCWTHKFVAALCFLAGCSPAPQPQRAPSPTIDRTPKTAVVEAPKVIEVEKTPYRAPLSHGAELYLPATFAAGKDGGYDLIVHFHGEGRWQQENVEHAKLNVAVVSVNLGAGTEHYAKGFKAPDAFEKLLAETQAEMVKSGRADNAHLNRLALSAWSAGFSSIARVMTDDVAAKTDAILLADGFFTYFTEPKKRVVNQQGLKKFAKFAEQARKDEKLFAITHTTIPTGPNPSVQECVSTLLTMIQEQKTPKDEMGPRPKMHQIYAVDRGSLHVRGFEGTTAPDHVRQLHAMGETVYPYLKSRWK